MTSWYKQLWEWLKMDYHWVWIILFPIGILILLARLFGPRITVDAPSLVGADKKHEEVLNDLAAKDAANVLVREEQVVNAEKTHDAVVLDLIVEQKKETHTLLVDPEALTDAMLRAGKDAKQ